MWKQPRKDTELEVLFLFSSFQLRDSKAFNSNYTFGTGTLILYRLTESSVQILHVVHGRRNIEALFSQ